MKIVIDIPNTDYQVTLTKIMLACHGCKITELPKGHGDLIDRKDLIENGINKGFCDWYDEIKMADTIIEADEGSESE